MTRRAGVILPLFSAASCESWGIGELPDLAPLSRWLGDGGFSRLMILPIGPMAAEQASPYSAVSAMAIDPIYIAVSRVPDFVAGGGEAALPEDARAALATARHSRRIVYEAVRRAKDAALEIAFARFTADEWEQLTPRAAALAGYIARERWWLDDYALFTALGRALGTPLWRTWPDALRTRQADAVDDLRRQLAREVLRHQYLQWIAETQWQDAREAARAAGVTVIGDLPFVVCHDSADVWTRQDEFLLDVSAGAPPDAFSETGQDWHLPTYNWPAMAATDYEWLRLRARRMAALYDGFRVDHLVGFYRTFGRPPEGEPFFTPAHEPDQVRQGERILTIFRESGAELMAEDLGIVPDYVRESLARMGVPGSKVLRWERRWRDPEQPFIEPSTFPPMSVAMTGTHDTEPLALWWESASPKERWLFTQLPACRIRDVGPDDGWNHTVRDVLLEIAYSAGSNDIYAPLPDLFGWRDRINVPGTVGDSNWSWRLPWPVDALVHTPDAVERAVFCRALALASFRTRPLQSPA